MSKIGSRGQVIYFRFVPFFNDARARLPYLFAITKVGSQHPCGSVLMLSNSEVKQRRKFILILAKALLSFGAPSHRIESQLAAASKILGAEAGQCLSRVFSSYFDPRQNLFIYRILSLCRFGTEIQDHRARISLGRRVALHYHHYIKFT